MKLKKKKNREKQQQSWKNEEENLPKIENILQLIQKFKRN